MGITKEYIKEKYLEVKNELGKCPSEREFRKASGFSQYQIIKHFRTYGDLMKEIGDEPSFFGQVGRDEAEYWTVYGNYIRQKKEMPKMSTWNYEKTSPGTNAYLEKFSVKWAELPNLFFQYIKDKEEWQDVLELIPDEDKDNKKIVDNSLIDNELDVLIKANYLDYIPPILNDITKLSENDNTGGKFEEKVNLLFQLLGFEIEKYGQGSGRNPDGIAKAPKEHYAILIDAKSRKDAYTLGTEDRKFKEYIDTHKNRLNNQGYNPIYFLVVSSKFSSIPDKTLANFFTDTNVVLSFITITNLLKILAKKIEFPNKLDLSKLKSLFTKQGIISDAEVESALKKIN